MRALVTIAVVSMALTVTSPGMAQLSRPTACSDCIANWFYFDNNGGDAGSEDWNCGTRSYDGHRGSDFSLAGGNGAIPTGYDVLATADGVVESAQDGHYDRCGACGGSMCGTAFGFGYGNHVVINHGSYKVIYAHMRTGSIRVGVGDTVACGQAVGQIASSGCSTGAHLHVETRPRGGAFTTAFDPFQGGCSPTSPSLWTGQGPYRGLPDVTCGEPPPPTCPGGTFPVWTCSADESERVRCVDGVVMRESCAEGCVSMPVGSDDVCAAPTCPFGSSWSCDALDRVRCVAGAEERERCDFGCVDVAGGDALCRTGAVDADMDGHNTSVDCDDTNPAIFPGAVDPCGDGVDANCDGDDMCPVDDGGVMDAGTDAASDSAVDAAVARDTGRDVREAVGGCSCATSAPLEGAMALGMLALWARSRKFHF